MDLFAREFRIKVREYTQSVDERIASKARLWDFINDTKDAWLNWPDTPDEMAMQISTSCFTILFPHYTGIEIDRIIRDIYSSLKIEVPPRYFTIYADAYGRHVIAKIKKIEEQRNK